MLAKRTRVWKYPDTGAAKLPKVVDAQGTLRYPALYIWQNIDQNTTTTGPQDTDFERILTTSQLHIGSFAEENIPRGRHCLLKRPGKSNNRSTLDNCGKVPDHYCTFHGPDHASADFRGEAR
jgi:hypothetical protein